MQKILFITPKFYPSIGGIEEQVKLLWQEFLRLWYKVDILTYKKGREKSKEIIFDMNIFTFRWFLGFWQFFRKNKQYNIIISRQYYRHSFFLWLLKFFWIVKSKTIICTDSGGKNDEINTIKNIIHFLWIYKLYFFFIWQNNYLNCLNVDNIKNLQSIYKWKDKYLNKITNIYNWINISTFENNKIDAIENLLFLWRFEKEKWIFETIEAFKNIKNSNIKLHLVWYWNEKTEKKIKSIIKDDNRIIFYGKKYWNEKENIIKNTDLFIFPTYYPEWQPVTLTEIAIKNIPIISTKVANTYEIYWDNILYVKKQNTEDLQEKMAWIIKNINTFKYDYSKVLRKVDIKNITQQFLNL